MMAARSTPRVSARTFLFTPPSDSRSIADPIWREAWIYISVLMADWVKVQLINGDRVTQITRTIQWPRNREMAKCSQEDPLAFWISLNHGFSRSAFQFLLWQILPINVLDWTANSREIFVPRSWESRGRNQRRQYKIIANLSGWQKKKRTEKKKTCGQRRRAARRL